ncbi:hypothetical protein LAC81_07685 [Ensifer adhaerens]|uniref:hypothetical protein n=1 Tax=Ensifer adhaerens TaxID=106592 RepID=UPI001CC13944|nr:hypothetical protein [Ensifer adhaerens]MBZ7921661.1 hypothetical protein [Ensifer adhaerens]UAX94076.1 hypothetical protein LAC78_07680 [Ensifer adhaerens]UAY01710.1 hypothetical protein LAC80_07685 [Ensifer adhaerens]UAY09094.1 hypothetical protein LAC81_07685 [Ensifer adhaerens]
MAGLLDIAPVAETVTINGTAVEVIGISAEGIAYLFNRFPEIRMAITGRKVDADRWSNIGAGAVAAIIAAGCGGLGSEAHEKKAASLPAVAQADLLDAIMKTTMPGGPLPFVQRLMGMFDLDGVPSNTAPGTKSPKGSKP